MAHRQHIWGFRLWEGQEHQGQKCKNWPLIEGGGDKNKKSSAPKKLYTSTANKSSQTLCMFFFLKYIEHSFFFLSNFEEQTE